MKGKFKLGALAWGVAAVMAFPVGTAAADSNSADCIQQATANTAANDQCHQSDVATNTQTTITTGGPGGVAEGGNGAPSEATGDPAQADSTGGDAKANGGDAEAKVNLGNDQGNQLSGRDSVSDPTDGSNGGNNSTVCKQQAGPGVGETGNTAGNNQCRQDNTATNTQTTTTTGGAGGEALAGDGGPAEATGDAEANSQGGNASANGGDAETHAKLGNDQGNAISGRDSGADPSDGSGSNNGAVCIQQATGNTAANDQCHQSNTATNIQTTTTTGGAGGVATGGNSGPSLAVGDGAEAGSYGGNAYANGGDAEAKVTLDNNQSNQISGRDSSSGDGWGSNGIGGSNGAVCVQQATGNTTGAFQCGQTNTATNTQTTTTTGGAGGTATGGNAGPSLAVGDGARAGSQGGNASANGGDAETHASLSNRQSNQISGRDSIGDGAIVITYKKTTTTTTTPPTVTVVVYVPVPQATTVAQTTKAKATVKKAKTRSKKVKKAKKRAKGKVAPFVKCSC